MIKFIAVMASTPEGGIASNGKLPWNRPPDGKWFQQITRNHVVVMGYKTLEEIVTMSGGPLQNRHNVVITSKRMSGLFEHLFKSDEVSDTPPILLSFRNGFDGPLTIPNPDNLKDNLIEVCTSSKIYTTNSEPRVAFIIGGLTTIRSLIAAGVEISEFWHTVSTKPVDHEPDTFLELDGWDFENTKVEKLYEPTDGNYVVYRRHPTFGLSDRELEWLDKVGPNPSYKVTDIQCHSDDTVTAVVQFKTIDHPLLKKLLEPPLNDFSIRKSDMDTSGIHALRKAYPPIKVDLTALKDIDVSDLYPKNHADSHLELPEREVIHLTIPMFDATKETAFVYYGNVLSIHLGSLHCGMHIGNVINYQAEVLPRYLVAISEHKEFILFRTESKFTSDPCTVDLLLTTAPCATATHLTGDVINGWDWNTVKVFALMENMDGN